MTRASAARAGESLFLGGMQPADIEPLEALLRREEDHRMMNFLQVISSTLELQARVATNEVASVALRRANGQVCALGVLQRLLGQPQQHHKLSMRGFLEELSHALDTLIFVPRESVLSRVFDEGIALLEVEASRMRLLALGLTELLVNVGKHAIETRAHRVELSVRTTGANLVCSVVDEGQGMPVREGRCASQGLGLVDALSKALGGNCRWVFTNEGTSAEIRVPLSGLGELPLSIEPPPYSAVHDSSILTLMDRGDDTSNSLAHLPRWSQLKFLGWLGSL